MKTGRRTNGGFTRAELITAIVIVTLIVLLLPALFRAKSRSNRIICLNNLKDLGTAYRVWANDNGDKEPSEVARTNGGWSEWLATRQAGLYCGKNFALMSNELHQSTKTLVCPDDERKPAASFAAITNNLHLSYFVGAHVDDTYPQAILGGDRNLGPGTVPRNDYGFSPSNGLGNDVTLTTTNSVCWSLKMHSYGNSPGAGNIILGDGSAQQVTSAGFNRNWLTNAMTPGPKGVPSLRLIFP